MVTYLTGDDEDGRVGNWTKRSGGGGGVVEQKA